MKFPTVTIALVSAALIYVAWDQLREKPRPLDAARFENLASDPIERSEVLDWVTGQVPVLCEKATGEAAGSEAVSDCIEDSESFQPTCRRAAFDQFPETVASKAMFQDLSLSMMECLVRESRRVN